MRGLLDRLSRLEVSDEEFDSQLELLHKSVEAHVADEERLLFPRIRQLSDDELLQALGEDLRQTRDALSRIDPREVNAPDEIPGAF